MRIFLPSTPYMTCCFFFALSFEYGVSRFTPTALAMPSMTRKVQPSPLSMAPFHGAMAPSRMDRRGSGTTSSGSTSTRVPRPWQSGHMPSGPLNEKLCGLSSGNAWPQHMRDSLKRSTWAAASACASTSTTSSP